MAGELPHRTAAASEVAAWFSLVGAQSILTVFLVDDLLRSPRDAKALYHLLAAAVVLAPVAWPRLAPCAWLLDRARAWRGAGLTAASAVAALAVPWLHANEGPAAAFTVPGGASVLALLLSRRRRGRDVRTAAGGPDPHAFVRVIATAVKKLGTGRPGEHWLDAARASHPEEAIAGAKAVVGVGSVFAALTFFWALSAQKGSSWVLQAKELDLRVLGLELAAPQLLALHPALLVAVVPLLRFVVFPVLARRGVRPCPLRKMAAGMFLTVLSFLAAALLQTAIDHGGTPSVLWQTPQYLLLTSGEVLVAVNGLEFGWTQAPRAMRSTVTSLWLAAAACGNLLAALASKVFFFQGAAWFWFFAALMLVAAAAFAAVARRYRPPARALSEPIRAAAGE